MFLMLLFINTSIDAYITRLGDNPVDMIFEDRNIAAFKCRFGENGAIMFFSSEYKDYSSAQNWEVKVLSNTMNKWSDAINWRISTPPDGENQMDIPFSDALPLGVNPLAVRIGNDAYFVNTKAVDGKTVISFFRLRKDTSSIDVFTMHIADEPTDGKTSKDDIWRFVCAFHSKKKIPLEFFKRSNTLELKNREKNMPIYDFSDAPQIVPDMENEYWQKFFRISTSIGIRML